MIFVDTSAFLAIENRLDAHHSRALSLRDAWLKKAQSLVTSDYVWMRVIRSFGLEPGTPLSMRA